MSEKSLKEYEETARFGHFLNYHKCDTWVCAHVHVRVHVCVCMCACVRVCVCVQGCLFQRLWPLAFRYLEEHLRHKRHESTIALRGYSAYSTVLWDASEFVGNATWAADTLKTGELKSPREHATTK
jgi:hypothetical protein